MLTTHLRARALQAGALLAVVAGGIVAAPAVALAAEPEVQITSLQTEVQSGGKLALQYQVRNGDDDGQQTVEIQFGGDLRCTDGDCGQVTQVDQNGSTFNAELTAPDAGAGENRRVQVRITAIMGGERRTADQTVTVRGADRPENVRQISGKVRDQDGKNISGAAVAMQDSGGNRYQATSNGSGGFSFTSSDGRPIVAGNVQVGAGKDGYEPAQVQIQAAAGRSVTVSLTLKEVAATESPSPSASASAEASEEATDEASEPVADENTAATGGDQENTASTEDSDSSLLYFLIGGLLVAAGLGAVVLLWLRRRNAADNGDDDDPTGMGGGGGVVPPSRGRFNDATMVGAPPMAAGAAATMVAPRSGAPSMSDAPTMLHRPVPAVEDEFPDPYGAPIPQQGGYLGAAGAPAGGWDDQADNYGGGSNTYGAPTQYGRPVDDGYGQDDAYGAAPGGGYDNYGATQAEQPRRFDEPTGMYRPEQQDPGYDDYDRGQQYGGQGTAQPGQQYGGGAQQYGGGTYGGGGGWGAPGDGIDNNGNAYGPQGGQYAAPAGGQYGGAQYADGQYGDGQYAGGQYGGGYADDQGGYDQRGGYDEQHDEQQQRGYGEPPPQQPTRPGQRRSNEWGT